MAVHVDVGDDAVTITFDGLDRVLALCQRQEIAVTDLVAARVAPVAELKADRGWRLGGGWWPGGFATGWFSVKGHKGARQLWDVYHDREVLVIDTTLDRPCRVVLQTPDRHDVAWFIGERLAPR